MTTPSSDAILPETTRHRRLRKWGVAAALLTALALAAAACGGGGSSSSGGSTAGGTKNADSARQAGLAYAQCMRSHGVSNFPDSAISTTSGGGVKFDPPPGVQNNPHYQSAAQACHSKLPAGSGSGNSSTNVQAELKLASCMRSHGVSNYPEPNSQGQMIIRGGSNGVDPNSPTYQAAWKVCRKDLPNGGSGFGG